MTNPYLNSAEEGFHPVFEHLFEKRYLFVPDIRRETLQGFGDRLILLNKKDPSKDIYLIINSCTGVIREGLALFDLITTLPANVNTVAIGKTTFISTLILLAGTKRAALPNTRIMMREPEFLDYHGREVATKNELDDTLNMYQILVDILSSRTGQTSGRIMKDMKSVLYFSAQEAKDYGLVNLIF